MTKNPAPLSLAGNKTQHHRITALFPQTHPSWHPVGDTSEALRKDQRHMDLRLMPTAAPFCSDLSPAGTDSTFHGSPTATGIKNEDGTLEPPRKKQKRNKPTLSCEECVERKTKVRGKVCF